MYVCKNLSSPCVAGSLHTFQGVSIFEMYGLFEEFEMYVRGPPSDEMYGHIFHENGTL